MRLLFGGQSDFAKSFDGTGSVRLKTACPAGIGDGQLRYPKTIAQQQPREAIAVVPMPKVWPEAYLNRYKDLGKSVLTSVGIERKDKEARLQHFVKMFGLFEAPAIVLVNIDKALSLEYAMLDVGIFLQTFCLLAHDRGLGTCIMAAIVNYPEIVRELFSIPENKTIVMGAILGWPDPAAAVNQFERQRGALDEFVKWVK